MQNNYWKRKSNKGRDQARKFAHSIYTYGYYIENNKRACDMLDNRTRRMQIDAMELISQVVNQLTELYLEDLDIDYDLLEGIDKLMVNCKISKLSLGIFLISL